MLFGSLRIFSYVVLSLLLLVTTFLAILKVFWFGYLSDSFVLNISVAQISASHSLSVFSLLSCVCFWHI